MNGLTYIIFGITLIFVATVIGSSVVYFFKKGINEKINSCINGFASGVMIASSFFGLILPSIEGAENYGKFSFIPSALGILLGSLFLVLIDKIIPLIINHSSNSNNKLKKGKNFNHSTNINNSNLSNQNRDGLGLKKSTKLFLAVTFHNIPEGLAVGLAFGSSALIGTTSAYVSALSLAIGIAIQNIPEGTAVSLLLKAETASANKAFLLGSLSGIVEPIFAVIGLLLATKLSALMPWFLAFSAGAMLFVTVEDLIPEAKFSATSHIGSWGFIFGFILMLILECFLS